MVYYNGSAFATNNNMMKIPEKMTTEELADYLGVAKQTVNRWIREQNWPTEKLPGVKGGRARLILINRPVHDFIMKTSMMRQRHSLTSAAETVAEYNYNNLSPALRQICTVLQNMTPAEEKMLERFLAREGLREFLKRLGISDSEE